MAPTDGAESADTHTSARLRARQRMLGAITATNKQEERGNRNKKTTTAKKKNPEGNERRKEGSKKIK